ncbi:MAG: hypothetical protein RMJ35_11355 [Phycisphaerales bacterium]|nr:hypothetical protein [Phycisphaerales bacterium]
MSRTGMGPEPIPVQPGNNIYTVLAGVAVLVQVLTLLVLFLKYNAVFEGWPFTMSK